MKNSSYQDNASHKYWITFLSIILVTLGFFIWLSINVRAGKTFLIDEEAFALTFAIRSHFMNIFMQTMTFLGSSFFLLPANIMMVFVILFFKKNRLIALQWAITALVSLLLMYFFKGIYQRSRPLDPFLESAAGFSFPSGHTLNGFIFFGLLIFILWKFFRSKSFRVGGTILFVLIIFTIGLSRIYLRVHYASDILGGWTLGICWLTISIFLFGLLDRKRKVQ